MNTKPTLFRRKQKPAGLEFPARPQSLVDAQASTADAKASLEAAVDAKARTCARINVAGQKITSPEEIAILDALIDDRRAAYDQERAHFEAKRRAHEAKVRKDLEPALDALMADISDRIAGVSSEIQKAIDLRAQAHAAGLSLDHPIVALSDRFEGLLRPVRHALARLEGK